MKKLYLGNGDKQFKFADTTTEIHLNALDNGSAAALTTNAKVRIKNESGYLLDVNASITNNHAVITSGQLSKLPTGNYLLELWDTADGGTAIYPSDGFLALKINENVTGLSGGLVSSITVNDFVQQFSSLSEQLKQQVSDAVSDGLKGEKGDPGKDFKIVKTFQSVSEMNGDGFSDGDFTMIASDVNDPDNGKLYVWNGTGFTYIADLSGSQGIAPGSITSEMLGIGVVKHDNIADKQVDKFKLADSAVVAGKIADGSVIDGNIAIAAVNTDNVKDKAITGFKLADAAVTSTKLGLGATKFDNVGDKQIYGRKLKHEGRPCWAYSEQLAYNEAILIVNDGATDTDPGTVAFNPKATTIAFFFEDKKIMTTPDKIKLDTTVLSFTSKQAIYVYLDPATLTMYLGKVHNPADLEKLMSDCVYLGMAFPPYMADKSNNRIGIDWNGVFTEDIKRRPFGGMGKYIGPAITADFNAGSFTIPAGTRNVFCHPIGLVHPMNDNGTPNNDALTLPFDGTVYLQALLFNMRTGKFLVLRMNYTLDFRYSDYVAIAYADLTAKKLVLL